MWAAYERLGGVFAIAAVVDHFSTAVVNNPIVGKSSKNPALREWHTKRLDRLPGLKFMRTLWVCSVAGGPFPYTATKPGKTAVGLEEAHRDSVSRHRNLTRSLRNSAARWTLSKCLDARRKKSSPSSHLTKARLRLALSSRPKPAAVARATHA